MKNDVISKIELQVMQTLSAIIGDVTPSIEDYNDMALLAYEFETPCEMEDVLDALEDDMGLGILYYAEKTDGEVTLHHACAIGNPVGEYMFKVNCITDKEDNVSALNITVFTSLEQMNNDLQTDLRNHNDNGFEFIDLMEEGTYAALFAI